MRKFLFLFFVLTLWSSIISAKGVYDSDTLTPDVDFFSPKSIGFFAQGGGSSHHFWILEMLKVLHGRGHNVSLHTTGDQMIFGKDYPMVDTFQLGPYDNFIVGMFKEGMLDHPPQHLMALSSSRHATKEYIRVFRETQEMIKARKLDLVIADLFTMASADAAIYMNIPVVLTSTFNAYPDSIKSYSNGKIYTIGKTTINDESMYERIYNKFYVPYIAWKTTHSLKDVMDFQRKLGFEPSIDIYTKRHEKVTKIVNNAYGLEVPREISQLTHMVGPILRTSYPNIDKETKLFLSEHKRTVYVAFGQHTMPSKEDIRIVLYNLLKLRSEGHFDGILWARLDPNALPQKMEITANNSSFTVSKTDILNDPDIMNLKWAPQYAILQHPSVILFVSHGGAGSIHEGLYSRVPLFVYPFFADQPYNSYLVKRLGVGDQIDTIQMKFNKKTYSMLYERLRNVLVDSDGKIARNVEKYANFLQIRSQNSVLRGVDILEECIFSSNEEGQLNYRQDIKYEVGWIKRNNVDLYIVILSFIGISGALVSKLVAYVLSVDKKTKKE